MRELNYYLLPALIPEPQKAADENLPKSLGSSSCYSEETGKELWRPQDLDWLFMELGEPQVQEQSTQNHRLLKLLASQMDPQNLSITISEFRDLRDHLIEPLIVQPEKSAQRKPALHPR